MPQIKDPALVFTISFPTRVNVLKSKVGIIRADDNSMVDSTTGDLFKYNRNGERVDIGKPPTYPDAVWDTGASRSALNHSVVSSLGLTPIDKADVYSANGKREAGVYAVKFIFFNDNYRNRRVVVTNDLHIVDGDIGNTPMLIGMDIIGHGDFAITHPDGKTQMTFSAPSIRDLDFSKEDRIRKAKEGTMPKGGKNRRRRR